MESSSNISEINSFTPLLVVTTSVLWPIKLIMFTCYHFFFSLLRISYCEHMNYILQHSNSPWDIFYVFSFWILYLWHFQLDIDICSGKYRWQPTTIFSIHISTRSLKKLFHTRWLLSSSSFLFSFAIANYFFSGSRLLIVTI